jgi:hypothetical protein
MADSKLRLPKPKLTNHPVDVGFRTEAAILAELGHRGYSVLVPWGVNQRYDLVLDLEGRFVRAQCKTGRLRDGTIEFNTASVQCNMQRVLSRDYKGDVDVFLVYCPDRPGDVYCVPVEMAGVSATRLRVEPTLNGQTQGIRWADDYELPG